MQGSAAMRSGWLRSWVVVLLGGALGCVAVLVALSGGTARPATTASHGLASLPLAAQGPVSAVLGQDESAYGVTALQAVNRAQHLHAGFSRRGVTVTSGRARLGMALSGYGYASALEPVGSVVPRASANRVSYAHGALTEWYVNGPLGIEQGFDLAARPSAATGPLTLSLALSDNLAARLRDGSVLLAGRGAALRYGGLVATDARGRVLRSWLQLTSGHVLIRVDDRGAAYPLRIDPFIQEGEKLTGRGDTGDGVFGASVALSANGNTALIGGPSTSGPDGGEIGAAWVFTRSGSTWSQQGEKLTGGGEEGWGRFGISVALSADGNTALIGGSGDDAAWVFTRSGSTWTQQGEKLTEPEGSFGGSVALSADGNTALIGGDDANHFAGAAWVFTRSGSTWTQQGEELTGAGEIGYALGEGGGFGNSLALSADGNTALIGGSRDNQGRGAAWVFTRSGATWTQQGEKLTGAEEVEYDGGGFGNSLALSSDGNTALIGDPDDNQGGGAAWVFTRSGATWTQQGEKLTGAEEVGDFPGEGSGFGNSVALSSDGNTALIGGPGGYRGDGAAWVFTRSNSTWAQQGEGLTGAEEIGYAPGRGNGFGNSLALSSDGNTVLIGGSGDDSNVGAAWVFVVPPTISSLPSMSFGSQTIGQPGPVLWLPVQNAGQAPLTFNSGAQIGGANAGDFVIPSGDDLCDEQTLQPEQTCWIGVQFTAAAAGPRTATLSFGANNSYPPAPMVALSGTGVAPNSGPQGPAGSQGAQGPVGGNGTNGPTGLQGSPGPQGAQGPSGKVEFVICTTSIKSVNGKRKQMGCKVELVTGPVTFTAAGAAIAAVLSRGKVVYATGSAIDSGKKTKLLLTPRHNLGEGSYMLTLTRGRKRQRETITID